MGFASSKRPPLSLLVLSLLVVFIITSIPSKPPTPPRPRIDVNVDVNDEHFYLFVGGLQRTGTTLLASLAGAFLESSSIMDAGNYGKSQYEMDMPWKAHNFTRTYFENVIRTGGVEGKFVQTVYPYRYMVREYGLGSFTVSDLVHEGEFHFATPRTGDALLSEWLPWWNTSAEVLVEKSPENIVMTLGLHKLLAQRPHAFIFTIRHPLAWSLAIDKWIKPTFSALQTVAQRMDFYLKVMESMVISLPRVPAAVVHFESLDDPLVLQRAFDIISEKLAPQHVSHFHTSPPRLMSANLSNSEELLFSNYEYIRCWLEGRKFNKQGCKAQVDEQNRSVGRSFELSTLQKLFEQRLNAFGYTLWGVTILDTMYRNQLSLDREDLAVEVAGRVPSLINSPVLRSHLASTKTTQFDGSHIIVLVPGLWRFGNRRTQGMTERFHQIISSLSQIEPHSVIHILCTECTIRSPFGQGVNPEVRWWSYENSLADPQCTWVHWSEPRLRFYAGSPINQVRSLFSLDLGIASKVRAVIDMATHLTMRAARLAKTDQSSFLPGSTLSIKQQRILGQGKIIGAAITNRIDYFAKQSNTSQQTLNIVVTDDIHCIRIRSALAGAADQERILEASRTLAVLERDTYAAADIVYTISQEDATRIRYLLHGNATPRPTQKPFLHFLPFVSNVHVQSAEITNRTGIFYLGTPHPVAIPSFRWLVMEVLPILHRLAAEKSIPSEAVQLHLGGRGWPAHGLTQQPGVTYLGSPDDDELPGLYRRFRCFVAPLFNATGVGTKVVNAMGWGIPVVTTRNGIAGLGFGDSEDAGLGEAQQIVGVQDDPEQYAREILRFVTCDQCWKQSATRGLRHIEEKLSYNVQAKIFQTDLVPKQNNPNISG